jgi:hypothetical protein
MKISILTTLLFFTTATTWGFDLKVNGTLSHEVNINWTKISKFRHSLDCYPKGKENENTPLGSEVIAASQNLLESNIIDFNSKFAINIGKSEFGIASSSNSNQSDISLNLNEILNWSSYKNKDDSKCVIKEYHWKVNSHKISGNYEIKIKIPKNVWLISLKITTNQGQLAKIATKISGDLHSAIINPSETILWVRPESEISIPISVSGYSGGSSFGSIAISVRKGLNSSSKLSQNLQHEIVQSQKNLTNITNSNLSHELKQIYIRDFLNVGHSILESSEAAAKITQTFNLEQNKIILDWLFATANDPSIKFFHYNEHVKAMAAAVGYQLSLSLLKDLMVFCKEIEIHLPLTDKTIRTSGLKAAYFWMNKDLKRLENIRFPEIRALIEEMVRWENQGLKYSSIAYNKQEFKKLDESYLKIRKFSEIGLDVFGDIKFGLNKTLSVFGSAGTNLLISNEIKIRLDKLANDRREINKSLTKLVMSFTYKNDDLILASKLLNSLNELEQNTIQLALDFKDQIKLVSVDSENQSSTALMTSLLSHQLALFQKPLKSNFIEPIRLLFYQLEQDQNLASTFNQCLGE